MEEQNYFQKKKQNKKKMIKPSGVLDYSKKRLENINFLVKQDLINIKVLHLEYNKLDDSQIPFLKKLNCINLEELYLGGNLFTDYELLTIVPNFPRLKILSLETNKLDKNIEILKNNPIEYNSVEILNLSNGIFSNQTIDFIRYLKFQNLKHLDLRGNDLSSLSSLSSLEQLINFGEERNKIKKLELLYDKFDEPLFSSLTEALLSNYLDGIECKRLNNNNSNTFIPDFIKFCNKK